MNQQTIPFDQKFYKYMSLDTALLCLKNGTLKFSAPSDLNDCLEAQYEEADPEAHVDIMLGALNEIAKERGERELYCERPLVPEVNAAILRGYEEFRWHMDRIGIFSTSCRFDNQAMWAYYAQNGTGLCFELDFDESLVWEFGLQARLVEYRCAPRIINRADFFAETLHAYANDHPDLNLQALQKLSREKPFLREWGQRVSTFAASIKHTDWRHEDELRVYSGKTGIKPMLARSLKRVFFNKTSGPGFAEAIYIAEKIYGAEIAQISFTPTGGSATPVTLNLIPVKAAPSQRAQI